MVVYRYFSIEEFGIHLLIWYIYTHFRYIY